MYLVLCQTITILILFVGFTHTCMCGCVCILSLFLSLSSFVWTTAVIVMSSMKNNENDSCGVFTKTTERHSTLQSTLSWHQSSCAWWCRGVNCCLARGTCYLSPATSRLFPMVLGDTAGAIRAWIFSLDSVWEATAAHTMCRSWRESVLIGHPEPAL